MMAGSDLRSRAATSRTVMISAFMTGVIAIATGVYLYITGRQHHWKKSARWVWPGAHSGPHPRSSHHISIVLAEDELVVQAVSGLLGAW
jgi:hypothetical protein